MGGAGQIGVKGPHHPADFDGLVFIGHRDVQQRLLHGLGPAGGVPGRYVPGRGSNDMKNSIPAKLVKYVFKK
jgi:hypothetical protein